MIVLERALLWSTDTPLRSNSLRASSCFFCNSSRVGGLPSESLRFKGTSNGGFLSRTTTSFQGIFTTYILYNKTLLKAISFLKNKNGRAVTAVWCGAFSSESGLKDGLCREVLCGSRKRHPSLSAAR